MDGEGLCRCGHSLDHCDIGRQQSCNVGKEIGFQRWLYREPDPLKPGAVREAVAVEKFMFPSE